MWRVPALLLPLLLGSNVHAGGGTGVVAAGAAGKAYVVFTEQGSVQYGTRKLTLTLYGEKGGELLWKRQINGQLYQSSGGNRTFPGWGVADSVLWMAHTTGGEGWHVDNTGFRLSDGKLLWEHIDVRPLAVSRGEILFQRLNSRLAFPDLREAALLVNDLETGATTRPNLHIPERPGCGDVNDYAREDAAYSGRWADGTFFYARRKDHCGVFVARFDWHGGAEQRPTVTPE